MATSAELQVKVTSKGVKQTSKELDNLTKESKQATKSTQGLGKAFVGLGSIIATGALFKSIIANTIEQDRVQAQLRNTIESTGMAAGITAEEMFKMAAGLQQVTTFGDEAIIGAQDLLLTFTKIGQDAFPDALEATLNLATAMGTDLKSAAIQVGKALNDPVKGLTSLSRSGIQFTEDQKNLIQSLVDAGREAEAQTIILGELETQFGNSARAARDTFGGAIQSLKNTFGDLLEGGGGNLNDATEAINELNKTLSDPAVVAGITAITSGLITMTTALVEAAAGAAGLARFLGEELAAAVGGPALDDTVRLNEELESLLETQARLQQQSNRSGKGGERAAFQLAQTNKEIEAIQNLLRLNEELTNEQNKPKPVAEEAAETTKPKPITDVADAVTVLTAAENELTEAQKRQIEAAKELERIRQTNADRASQIFEQTRTELEVFSQDLAELNTLYEQGFLDTDTYTRAIEQMGGAMSDTAEAAKEETGALDEFAKTAQERIQGDIADVLTGKFTGSFDDILDGWTDLLIRMGTEAIAADLTKSLFSDGGAFGGSSGGGAGLVGGAASLFAGFFDNGGNIGAGKFGVVGERGPEIVTGPASVTGRQDTAKQMGNTINISLPGIQDARQAREASGQIQRAVGKAVSGSQRYQ